MPDIGYVAMITSRPGRTKPIVSQIVDEPLELRDRQKSDVNGQVDNPPSSPWIEVLAPLEAARINVNSAVDEMVAQYTKDRTVTRVGVAQLRDAIDELRQSIPRQTSKRRAGGFNIGDE